MEDDGTIAPSNQPQAHALRCGPVFRFLACAILTFLLFLIPPAFVIFISNPRRAWLLVPELVLLIWAFGYAANASELKRRLRFHLSTVIIMMFAAGVLIGANVSAECVASMNTDSSLVRGFGWPLTFTVPLISVDPRSTIVDFLRNLMRLEANTFIALSFVVAVAFFSESLIRRREARKP